MFKTKVVSSELWLTPSPRASSLEDASREGEPKCWFGEGGCLESSEMESGSWRDSCWSGVNPAAPIHRDKPGSKLN